MPSPVHIAQRRARILGALALAAAAACQFKVSTEENKFVCQSNEDCGDGWVCVPQKARDYGACFRDGACLDHEVCNGVDDDCNGVVDDDSVDVGAACVASALGECAKGTTECVNGVLRCKPGLPTTEICDTKDNDCNGAPDEPFDLHRDNANCGSCGHACAVGAQCASSRCAELVCSDGVDNNQNTFTDCDDPDCLGLACDTAVPSLENCGNPPFPDGGVDGGTDDAGAADAATDGGADGGGPITRCVPREAACGNASDDDGDGLPDCADPDCLGLACDTAMPSLENCGNPPFPDGGVDAGADDAGAADGATDGGVPVTRCVPREAVCDDASDDDGDALLDCADLDCDGKTCAAGKVCASRACP